MPKVIQNPQTPKQSPIRLAIANPLFSLGLFFLFYFLAAVVGLFDRGYYAHQPARFIGQTLEYIAYIFLIICLISTAILAVKMLAKLARSGH